MLGIDYATVLSLLDEGDLGSMKIGDTCRIFLSDLETYLEEDRVRSLIQVLTGGEPEPYGKKQAFKYEAVAEQWKEIPKDEAIMLSGLSKSDLQNIRDLLYSRFGKETVIVQSDKQEKSHWVEQPNGKWVWKKESVIFKAVVCTRAGKKYLRD
ncbi:excisionase family DNA binding protein [Salinibacter ruber]|nr:excisionase family DNA binding protein [Salinibacter ruber]